MRVATQAYTDSMVSQFNNLSARQYNLQSQASTGLRVQAPSDDPTAMQNTLNYLSKNATQQQYASNISTLQSRANLVNNALQSIQTSVSNAGDIVIAAGQATPDLSALTGQVNTLINQVLSAANAKDPSTGQYLFGGTASGSAPYTATKDANGNVLSVTYNGNSSVNQTQVGDNLMATVDVPGENSTSSGAHGLITDQQSGADLLNHLISLRDNLQSGNTAAITATDSGNLQKDEDNISYQVANNGVQLNQLSAAATFAQNSSQSLSQMISDSSSANLVNTMVELNQAQTAYQAALQSGSKIMNLSLLNYIQ